MLVHATPAIPFTISYYEFNSRHTRFRLILTPEECEELRLKTHWPKCVSKTEVFEIRKIKNSIMNPNTIFDIVLVGVWGNTGT